MRMKINWQLLDKTDTYIIGVSGGVDSMALLDMLHREKYTIVVCHVNYHYRYDSDVDQQLVESYCKDRSIPYFIKNVEEKENHNGNFQMQARILRYTFYYEIAKKYNTDRVILGHHKDDCMETIYMQLARNSTKGYLGIQPISKVQNVRVYRPLLEVSKKELYEYCQNHQVLYHEDYTNFQTDFTRDYVRNEVLPTLSKLQKKELLKRTLEHNQRYLKRQEAMQPYYKRYQEMGYINYKLLTKQQLLDMIYYMIAKVVYPPYISDTLVQEISKQINSEKPNIIANLPVNSLFIKEYDNIRVSIDKENGSYCLKYNYLVYDKHDYFYLSKAGHINEGIYLEQSDFPITIRCFRPGDVIKTSGGTKKVSRLFIDNKIPKSERNIWPIVERFDGTIVLIPHIAKNIGYLYTKPNVFVVKYRDLRSEKDA